ncbi:uncharacterized protein JCM6883_007568 [Sporobolomyces salmoneus]|uniref:uncharacterized protein n=1 Tax=Sporobolomyces salmoneus TaxID=183962 RepID=UPI00317B49B1
MQASTTSVNPTFHDATDFDKLLQDWAPRAPPLDQLPPSHAEPYLPSGAASILSVSSRGCYRPTSKPFNLPLSPNQESMSYSLARLLSRPRFASFLSTPLGYSQFKAHLSQHAPPELVTELELWKDLSVLRNLNLQNAFAAKGLSKVYQDELVDGFVPRGVSKELVQGLQGLTTQATGLLRGPTAHLLDSFYASEFENFMRSRLVTHTQEQLTRYQLHGSEARTGIGEAYVLVNPRLQDRPIVLVSPGFEKLTGYRANQIIGRNCRFLQGKSSSPAAVKAIKKAVDGGYDITQLILNYTAEGRPFMNLLTMIALHDAGGNLTYIVGGQTDLTEPIVNVLQSHEEIFNASLDQLSEPVQIEAKDSAVANESLKIDMPVSLRGAEGDGSKEGVHQTRFEKLKELYHKLVGEKLSFKREDFRKETQKEEEKPQEGGVLVPPRSATKNAKAIESIALEYSTTYDKLLVVKQSNREIVFATSGFLRHVALPGTTRQDIEQSPLVHLDLLEIVVAPTHPPHTGDEQGVSTSTKEVREKVKRAIEKGVQASFACGIQYKGAQDQPQASIPLVSGRLYISPLRDMLGLPAASSVVFA